jgi:hypothetical protein
MNVFLAFDGDSIGASAERMALQNNIEGLRQVSHAIEAGNALVCNWALANGGSIISSGGDEGRLIIPVSKLMDLEQIRHQYFTLVGATLSVGIGMQLAQADQALVVSKLNGKNRTTMWTQEVEKIIQEKLKPKTEEEKLRGLNKADEGKAYENKGHTAYEGHPYDKHPAEPAKFEGDPHAGIKGKHRPISVLKPTPAGENKPHKDKDGKDLNPALKLPDMPESPKKPGKAKSHLATAFHKIALKQAHKDQESGTKQETKAQIVKILEEVRNAVPIIQELKSTAPQAYKAVTDSIQAMVQMARDLHKSESIEGEPSQNKEIDFMKSDQIESQNNSQEGVSEDEFKKAEEAFHKKIADIPQGKPEAPKEGAQVFDYSHVLGPKNIKAGYSMKLHSTPTTTGTGHRMSAYVFHNNKKVGEVAGRTLDTGTGPALKVLLSEVHPQHRGKGLGTSGYEAMYAHSLHTHKINQIQGIHHSGLASIVHQKLARKHGFDYKPQLSPEGKKQVAEGEEPQEFDDRYNPYKYTIKAEPSLEKVSLKPHLTQPPGTIVNGKIKVIKPDTGKQVFESARSGIVKGPQGQAVSAKSPNKGS